MILHDDDGDDNDDNDDDCFCHRYMQAMSHGYACKCLLVSSLALIRHTNCVLPQEPLALLFAHAVASTAICSKKAIPKKCSAVFAQQVSRKSARLEVTHACYACHASWKASGTQLMHEQATGGHA